MSDNPKVQIIVNTKMRISEWDMSINGMYGYIDRLDRGAWGDFPADIKLIVRHPTFGEYIRSVYLKGSENRSLWYTPIDMEWDEFVKYLHNTTAPLLKEIQSPRKEK